VKKKDGKWNVNGSSIYWGVFFRMTDEELPIKNPSLADRECLWGPKFQIFGEYEFNQVHLPNHMPRRVKMALDTRRA
jgi:hypothetical protein